MPWLDQKDMPDLSIVNAVHRIAGETKPRFWILENVRGAVYWLGKPSAIYGPIYLWGFFPDLGRVRIAPWKEKLSGAQQQLRAFIPGELSEAVAKAIEKQEGLF